MAALQLINYTQSCNSAFQSQIMTSYIFIYYIFISALIYWTVWTQKNPSWLNIMLTIKCSG